MRDAIVTLRGKTLRAPCVENKYCLDILQIRKLVVKDRSQVHEPLFWRNDVIKAWCCEEAAEPSAFGDETEYWLGIYDEDAPAYAGKFRFYFSTFGGMCGYEFKKFFNPREIENEWDYIIQKKFLQRINTLLDLGILAFPDKGGDYA